MTADGISQGDIIKIHGYSCHFLVLSKNAYIHAASVFHVCPVMADIDPGPLHIKITGIEGVEGVVVCEQLKLIDPVKRSCRRVDRIDYGTKMNISDAIQGIFEYD